VAVIFDVVFALSEGIPKLNGLVTRTRNNLSVVGAEANRQNIRGVSDEATRCETGVKVPEAQRVVPR